MPRKDETDYALRIDGLVDRPTTYTLEDLRALRQTGSSTTAVHRRLAGGEHRSKV